MEQNQILVMAMDNAKETCQQACMKAGGDVVKCLDTNYLACTVQMTENRYVVAYSLFGDVEEYIRHEILHVLLFSDKEFEVKSHHDFIDKHLGAKKEKK